MRARSVLAPVALAAAVVAVVLGVAAVAGSGGGASSRPALLHLASAGGVARAGSEPAGAGTGPASSPYHLDGTLPAGQHGDRPVWRVRHADSADATRVARALGLSGTPTRIDGGWVLRAAAGLRLAVREDGSWSFGMDCFTGQPVDGERLDVMCASAAGGSVAVAPDDGSEDPTDPPMPAMSPGPDADTARAAAAPILHALGGDAARVTATQGTPTSTVRASYDVDGVPTTGLTTTLSFLGNGSLASGDGWLVAVTKGDSYPVITAQRAFELLNEQPRPMLEMCLRRSDGKPGCADIPPAVITGATLGLTMAQDGGRATLVPAWLFTVRGQSEPLAQIAVDPHYLAGPEPAHDLPTTVAPNVTPAGASPA